MAVAPRRLRRRPIIPLILLALLILGLGWLLYLRLTDQPLRDPFGIYRPDPAAVPVVPAGGGRAISPPAEGMQRVLISAREIPAYAKVSRDDLFDPRRGIFAYMDLDEDFVRDNGVLSGTASIIGRVMKRPKRPGFAFTEADFLPEGTRAGLAGGIPPGKRALRIDVDLVRGIIGLNPGDRFDVVAARTIEPVPPVEAIRAGADAPAFVGVYSEIASRRDRRVPSIPVPREAQAQVDVIVQGGVVVSPLETRLIPTTSTSLTAGQITGTRPVQEMVIALAPEEVAPLMAALRLDADLTCLARSGRPEDPVDSVTPGLVPSLDDQASATPGGEPALAPERATMPAGYDASEFTVVETIVGSERTLMAVPKAASGRQVEEEGDGR